MSTLLLLLPIIPVAGALGGLGYYSLCLWSALRFTRSLEQVEKSGLADRPPFTPPVTILKPLRGTDPEMMASFRSHCLQDYPEYEIIFGVSDATDPAVAVVTQLQEEFPDRAIRVVVCEKILGTNIKVSNLIQMLPYASHEHLLVNDSDIRVDRDYLRRVFAPFAEAKVGMVTTLYRGITGATLPSMLESLGISTDFSGGVLAARLLEGGLRFGLGSTLALTKTGLAKIGGLEDIVDFLADDYQLGRRLHDAGYDVMLSDVVVDTFLPSYTWREFIGHQLRWARNVRDARKWGYLGVLFTFGLPWAMLAVLSHWGSPWMPAIWVLLGTVGLIRLLMAVTVGVGILRDGQVLRSLWLVPLRDVIAMALWFASFAGNTIVWRGVRFRLKDGRLAKV